MKLRENVDLLKFLTAVKACSGEVLYKTAEGDVLNLKSQLSQYIFLAVLISPDNKLPEGKIVCDNGEDIAVLMAYLAQE